MTSEAYSFNSWSKEMVKKVNENYKNHEWISKNNNGESVAYRYVNNIKNYSKDINIKIKGISKIVFYTNGEYEVFENNYKYFDFIKKIHDNYEKFVCFASY